jgi:flagellar basal body-associated protein FliL
MEDSFMAEPGSTAKPNAETKPKIESKPIVENKAVDSDEPRGKSRKLWIIIGALLFVLVAAGAMFMALPFTQGARTALWTKVMGKGTPKSEEVKATLPLEPFLVNLADSDEVRFVKTTFQLGLAEEPKEEMKNGAAIAAIRDSIISLLTSKKSEQILTPEGKDALRHEIRSRVNSISPKIKVLEVYIVDFVVQL